MGDANASAVGNAGLTEAQIMAALVSIKPEVVPEPRPWWRLLARLGWALGVDRPKLAARAFIDTIYAVVAGGSARHPALKLIAAELAALRKSPDLPAAMACERLFYEVLPSSEWRAELWSLRDRFRRVASDGALAGFEASKIADLATASDAAVIAELRSLVSYTHKSYELTFVREIAVARLKRWLLMLTLAFLIGFASAAWTMSEELGVTAPRSLFMGLGLIMLAGGVGAVMSVARRMQVAVKDKVLNQDPLFEIAALELGRWGIILSCVIGSVFSLLIFALLYGGSAAALGLSGGLLLPSFQKIPLGTQTGLAHALALVSDADLARALALAFVAGFAERLVPDALDRIVTRADAKK